MERLTVKHEEIYEAKYVLFDALPEICQKLGQLEDIEEELGVDLITLFIWFKYMIVEKHRVFITPKAYGNEYEWKGIYQTKSNYTFDYNKRCFIVSNYAGYMLCHLYFKDYGKTWALTKKELEK